MEMEDEIHGLGKSEREGRRQEMERRLEAEAGKRQSEREGQRQKQGQKRRAKERNSGKEGFYRLKRKGLGKVRSRDRGGRKRGTVLKRGIGGRSSNREE